MKRIKLSHLLDVLCLQAHKRGKVLLWTPSKGFEEVLDPEPIASRAKYLTDSRRA